MIDSVAYLLDTDHLSIIQRRSGGEYFRLKQRIAACDPSSLTLSVVSLHEQSLGCNRYIQAAKDHTGVVRGYAMLLRILDDYSTYPVLAFDDSASIEFERLRSARVRVATMDLRFASIALSRRLTLLTRNSVDFSRVPGLSFEDWTQ